MAVIGFDRRDTGRGSSTGGRKRTVSNFQFNDAFAGRLQLLGNRQHVKSGFGLDPLGEFAEFYLHVTSCLCRE